MAAKRIVNLNLTYELMESDPYAAHPFKADRQKKQTLEHIKRDHLKRGVERVAFMDMRSLFTRNTLSRIRSHTKEIFTSRPRV